MIRVNLEDFKEDLSELLRQVESGDSFLILHAGRVVAEITPVEAPSNHLRPVGLCKGEFVVPDDFDAPLPPEILRAFDGQ
jgi:antitoxin (DNA-binding transcriptional repressor) of toxin-antitoxin stability system